MKNKLNKYKQHLKYKFRCAKNAVNLWLYNHWWKIITVIVFLLVIITNIVHNRREKEIKVDTGLIDYVDMRSQLIPQKNVRTKTKFIVVHHSASELPSNRTPEQYILDIQTMHTNKADKNHGWSSIAYHFIVCDSVIYYCQKTNSKNPGVYNMNSVTLNVCLIGNFEKREPTAKELETLERLLRWLRTAYKLPEFCCHNDLNNTKCCGVHLKKRIKPLFNELNNGR